MQGTTVSVSLPFLHLQKMCVGGGVKCQQLSLSSNQEISCSLQFFQKLGRFGKYRSSGGLGSPGGPGPVWDVRELSFRSVTTLKLLSLFRVPTEPEEVAAEVFPSFAQSERAGPVERGRGVKCQQGPHPSSTGPLLYLPNRSNF